MDKFQSYGLIFMLLILFSSIAKAEQTAFTQEDRERLIRLEAITQQNSKELAVLKATLQEFKQSTDKRFAELREDMNKRFDQMFTFLWILAGIFTALTAGTIGFALWDRKTMLKEAKRETIEETRKIVESLDKGKIEQLLLSLKELAKVDNNVAEALKKFNLL